MTIPEPPNIRKPASDVSGILAAWPGVSDCFDRSGGTIPTEAVAIVEDRTVRRWTDDEDRLLWLMKANRRGNLEIGAAINRTANAVRFRWQTIKGEFE